MINNFEMMYNTICSDGAKLIVLRKLLLNLKFDYKKETFTKKYIYTILIGLNSQCVPYAHFGYWTLISDPQLFWEERVLYKMQLL